MGFNFYVSTSFICCNQDFNQVFTFENMMGWWLHVKGENINYFAIDKMSSAIVAQTNFWYNSWIENSLKDKCALSTFCKILTIFLSNGCKELLTIVLLKIIEDRMRKVTRRSWLLTANVSLDNWKRRIGAIQTLTDAEIFEN